eukprot:scaffold1128_cov94-Cylindrotheca_fusiformis.AAC.1
MRNSQQSVSTRSSRVHRPRELRKRDSESGGGKKKHARGEGGVPVSRPRSASTTHRNKKCTKKRSSNDMYSHTKRSDPIEEDTDDDNVSTSSPPPQMNKYKKRTKWRQDEDFQAKFTSSNNGLNHRASISNAIKSFNEKCEFVAEKRSIAKTGSLLEKKLQDKYTKRSDGEEMQADTPGDISKQQQGNSKSHEYVKAYMDYDLAKALEDSSTAV